MFYFRINRLRIVDNRENRRILRVFGEDTAEVKLTSFITTEGTQIPELDELLHTANPVRQRQILGAAVARVVDSRVLTTIQNVTDHHEMTFGDTGFVLYQSDRIPSHFDWILLAIESDRDTREMGQAVDSVVNHREFDQLATKLVSLASTAANPAYAAAIGVSKFVAKTLAERLRHDQDDMIGILYMSLNRIEHYLHGERKKDNVADLTNNMFVDYSLFGFDPQPQPQPIRRLPPVAPTPLRPRRVPNRRAS